LEVKLVRVNARATRLKTVIYDITRFWQPHVADQPAADINEAPNAAKRRRKEAEDFAIEGARLIGMTHSVNHATHQSHQTIKLKPA
jgi:hypothetical protein